MYVTSGIRTRDVGATGQELSGNYVVQYSAVLCRTFEDGGPRREGRQRRFRITPTCHCEEFRIYKSYDFTNKFVIEWYLKVCIDLDKDVYYLVTKSSK